MTTWLDYLWTSSWQLALLIAIVLLVRRVFALRLGPRWTYLLWLPVLIRLLLPPIPASWGMTENMVRPENWIEPVRTMGGHHAEPAVNLTVLAAAQAAVHTPDQSNPAATTSLPGDTITWDMALVGLWLLGVGGVLAWQLLAWWRWQCLLRSAQALDHPLASKLLNELSTKAGLRRPPTLVTHPSINGPCLGGLWRPVIVLPADPADAWLEHVLAHEIAHCRHRDTWANLLIVLVQALHWFNPLVWLGLRALISDREAVRDAEAIHLCQGDARSYGHSLLTLASTAAPLPVACWRAALTEEKGSLPRRIKMLTQHRSQFWSLTLGPCLLLALLWLGCTSAIAVEAKPEKAPTGGSTNPGAIIKRTVLKDTAPWVADIRKKLSQRISFVFEENEFDEVIDFFRSQLDVNIVTLHLKKDPPPITIKGKMRVDTTLDWIAELSQTKWSVTNQAIVFGTEHTNLTMSEIIYDISPLIKRAEEEQVDGLLDLIPTMVAPDSWHNRHASITSYNELLPNSILVRQSPAVQEEIHTFLRRLATVQLDQPLPQWQQDIETKLAQKISLELEDLTLDDCVRFLQRNCEVNLVLDPQLATKDLPTANIKLKAVTLGNALEFLSLQLGFAYFPHHEAIYITKQQPPEGFEIFDVAWIGSKRLAADNLQELIAEHFNVETAIWAGFLLVQIPTQQRRDVDTMLKKLQALYKATSESENEQSVSQSIKQQIDGNRKILPHIQSLPPGAVRQRAISDFIRSCSKLSDEAKAHGLVALHRQATRLVAMAEKLAENP